MNITSSIQPLPYAYCISNQWSWEVWLKIKCFTWLVIHNHILIWVILRKKGFMGLDRCSLCRFDSEDLFHLFLQCPFVVAIWIEVSTRLGVNVCRDCSSIHACICSWALKAKSYRVVPLYVLWGIWYSRNKQIFEAFLLNERLIPCGLLHISWKLAHGLLMPLPKLFWLFSRMVFYRSASWMELPLMGGVDVECLSYWTPLYNINFIGSRAMWKSVGSKC